MPGLLCRACVAFFSLFLLVGAGPGPDSSDEPQDSPQRKRFGPESWRGVYKGKIAPHWFDGDSRFWYRNDLKGGTKQFILVDADAGKRAPAFDHARMAARLSKAAGKEYHASRLPFDAIEFVNGGKALRFKFDDTTWICDLTTYECSKAVEPKGSGDRKKDTAEPAPAAQRQPPGKGRDRDGRSPDRKWTALIKDYNFHIRDADGKEFALTRDGKEGLGYGMLEWSPDSKALVAFRIEPGERKEVYLIESSPSGGGRAKLHTRPYALPGDKFTTFEMHVFNVAAQKEVKCDVEKIDFGFPRLRWQRDGHTFTYTKVDRGHQRYRLIEVDALTGTARNIIDEKTDTFIWTAHTENLDPALRSPNWLERTEEIIYASERDGWRHLYLIDATEGKVKNQITRGEYVVRGIDRIDEKKRQVWFRASGRNAGQDPYLIHYYRINFDGTDLVALTEGYGNHAVQFSPGRKYLVDSYNRVDLPPVHELRRVSDGKLVCELERADASELRASGWEPPEVFAAKGRDGKTDIWGIICRPRNFDPNKKYPVIEDIYAGPHDSHVPKTFSDRRRYAELTDLGFIVVKIDGMGTANRSKAFHDVCWHNLKDAGFPDRILWHKAVAAKYPYYDITHVGIYGTSAGGQSAAGAVLFHGEFYKAAVATCGCHDNRMDKASWNEQWMGYPVGTQYSESSNIDNARRLSGKLMLIVGEMDENVPPESTLRFADALIKARKDFDLIVVPGMGHSNGGLYGMRRMQDFFVRHLQGVEPPNRNGGAERTENRGQRTEESGQKPEDRGVGRPADVPAVTAPPESFFEKFAERDREAARRFYKKHLDVAGLSVAAAAEVDDEALRRTRLIVTRMLAGRPDILAVMGKNGTRLIVIGKDQVYTDMPEYRNRPNAGYLNERVRGTGGLDVTSFGEENLLNLPADRYDDESIAVHEFCHTIDAALRRIDPKWRERLSETYRAALDRGLWKDTYTASNPAEYWAEICQSYFDCNRLNNWNHGPIGTREQLKLYDPAGYALVRDTFRLSPETDWRFRPLQRQPSVTGPPAKLKVAPYYTKFTYAREFPVLGSKHVSDEALLRANDTIRKMFAYRHDILKAMIADGARLVVLGRAEKISDLPEFEGARKQTGFDEVRYLDYTPEKKLLVVPEENVLGLRDDPFAGRCMTVSVFARAIHRICGLREVIPDFDRRRDKQQYELRVRRLDVEFDQKLRKAHEAAQQKGLWKGTAAGRDHIEYWTAGLEAYFDAAGDGPVPHGADRSVATRETLKAYDPDLYALVDETMAYRGRVDWRYQRPAPRE